MHGNVYCPDGTKYHIIFDTGLEGNIEFKKGFKAIFENTRWIQSKTLTQLIELQNLSNSMLEDALKCSDKREVVQLAKEKYKGLNDVGFELHNLIRSDVLQLYKLKKLK